jgi:hypothetical protein
METKNCQNCKQDFTIEPDDFSFYGKINVPPPTWCPECRMIRRMSWRNERNWHKRICDATGKPIISSFSKDCPYKVYELNYWRSDEFDAMVYGSDYDFSRDFFTQFNDLLKTVPHPNLIQKNSVDCEYSNYSINCKNCYVVASAVSLEDCCYALGSVTSCKKSLDVHQSNDCESCYEIIDCIKCYELFFGQNCEGCISSYFLYDCRNSSNCIACVGLRNASYFILNKQYTKDAYLEEVKKLNLYTREGLQNIKEKFEELKKSFPRKYAIINKAENCIGDDINNARNCKYCFYARNEVENIKYSFKAFGNTKDGYDAVTAWDSSELFCECVSISGQRVYFSQLIWGGFDIEYSYNCFDCNNIFGCVGLRNKSYCVFNKQYSKEEYKALVASIREQMGTLPYVAKDNTIYKYGEFLPSEFSPYGYNDSLANDYFPLEKAEAANKNFNWQEKEEKNYSITIYKGSVPDEPSDGILSEVIECRDQSLCTHNCSSAFKIVPEELTFYKSHHLPLPEFCPSCRHKKRVELKNPLKLWHRACMCNQTTHAHGNNKCEVEFETSYAPDRPEKIYCEKCYQQEVL